MKAAEKKQLLAEGCEGVRAFLPSLTHHSALLPPADLCCECNGKDWSHGLPVSRLQVGQQPLLALLALLAPATELCYARERYQPYKTTQAPFVFHITGILYPVFVFSGNRSVHRHSDSCEQQNSASKDSPVCLLSVISDLMLSKLKQKHQISFSLTAHLHIKALPSLLPYTVV